MNPKPLRHVDIFTDAGRLEGLFRDVDNPVATAVIGHPLPTGGGTMHSKVVFRAAKGLESLHIATLRFNFRGTGKSEGEFDNGKGEQRDFEGALKWMAGRHPGIPLLAGGFSFGGWVASQVACDHPAVSAVFIIGAPVNRWDLSSLRDCRKPVLFIHGTKDEHGDSEKVEELANTVPDAEIITVSGADHFFTNQVEVVGETIREWAERRVLKPE
ncbi:MAG TPA: alpha/beta fold hydrolase [Thermoanaerobaculia bacterium]|nr:alpha/beta fold hydrolase [Thermoanaerobaculia bacterium]